MIGLQFLVIILAAGRELYGNNKHNLILNKYMTALNVYLKAFNLLDPFITNQIILAGKGGTHSQMSYHDLPTL